ncbi:hypothetical protein Rhal01_00299 [Rubritalea halochordaticola]|uniref:DUF3857 domain-containing protein n=1 Tax=Rubritalea halochordaticola TaxID=714537 RepID=A0ABP9UUV8_9BACT
MLLALFPNLGYSVFYILTPVLLMLVAALLLQKKQLVVFASSGLAFSIITMVVTSLTIKPVEDANQDAEIKRLETNIFILEAEVNNKEKQLEASLKTEADLRDQVAALSLPQVDKAKEPVAETSLEKKPDEKPAFSLWSFLDRKTTDEDLSYVREDFNIRLKLPGSEFIDFPEAEKLNAEASLAFRIRGENAFAIIIAEKQNPSNTLTPEIIHSFAVSNLKSNSKYLSELSPPQRHETHKEYIISSHHAETNNIPIRYYTITRATKEHIYQITLWKRFDKKGIATKHVNTVLNGFSLITPMAEPSSSPTQQLKISNHLAGFSLQFPESNWSLNNANHEDYSDTLYALKNDSGQEMLVYTLNASDLDCPEKTILDGLLRNENISESGEALHSVQVTKHGHQITEYRYTQENEGQTFQGYFEIAVHDSRYIALSTWGSEDLARPNTAIFWKNFAWTEDFKMPEKLSSEDMVHQADQLNKVGLAAYYDDKFGIAAASFRHAFELIPTSRSYGPNMIKSYENMGQNLKALAGCDEVLVAADLENVKIIKADLLATLNRVEESITVSATLFDQGCEDEEHLYTYINRLLTVNQTQKAVDVMLSYSKSHPSRDAQSWLAYVYRLNKEFELAEQTARDLLNNNPKDNEAHSQLINIYNDQELYEQSLGIVEIWKQAFPKSADPELAEANILTLSKKNKEAHELLLDLSKRFPENNYVKQRLTRSAAAIGLGDNTLISDSITPVPIPKHLQEELAQATSPENATNSEACYHHIITCYDATSPEEFRRTRYTKVKVNNLSGVREFNVWNISFNPHSEDICVNKLIVRDRQGLVVYQGTTNDYHISDEENGMATYDKTLTLPNKSLAPGYTIELVVTTTQWRDDGKVPLHHEWFGNSYPMAFCGVSLHGETNQLQSHISLPVEHQIIDDISTWWTHTPLLYYSEIHSPKIEKLLPRLSFAKEFDSWRKVSAGYHEYISKRFSKDKALVTEIQKIITPDMSTEVKAAKLINWVQSHCTYRAVEFGVRGRMPAKALDTLKAREGDCKDMSLLLWHMLNHAGITTHLALANTNQYVQPSVLSEDQFNHVVVYCPELENPIIDPTYNELDILHTPPENLIGDYILPITAQGMDLIQVKNTSHSLYSANIERELSLKDNKLVIVEKSTLSGFSTPYFRQYLSNKPMHEQIKLLQSIFASYYPQMSISSVHVPADHEQCTPYTVTITHEHPLTDDLKLPVLWEKLYFEIRQDNARKNKIVMDSPIRVTSATIISKGLEIEKIVTAPTHEAFQISSQEEGSILRYQSHMNPFTMEANAYSVFHSNSLNLIPRIALKRSDMDINSPTPQ